MKKSIKIALSAVAILASQPLFAQMADNTGFTTMPSGLKYKIFKGVAVKEIAAKATPKAEMGDVIEMHIHVHVGDSTIFDSRKQNNNNPVPFTLQKPMFHGDPAEGFTMMHVGDSAVFHTLVDSLERTGNKLLPWMKSGDIIEYNVVLVSAKSPAEAKKDAEEKGTRQVAMEDKTLMEYFAKNKIKAAKTSSGLYYKTHNMVMGEPAKAGQSVTVNYTGKTMDGKTFDSNVDSNFHHTQPFTFKLGQHQVIKGWDEGVALLKKGEKATLYIPSPLAYGAQSPSPAIPANSILIFDIEVTDIK